MLGCVFRCWGDRFDLDLALERAGWTPERSWHRGEDGHETTGFALAVSEAPDLVTHQREARAFLDRHDRWIAALRTSHRADGARLDFLIASRLGGDVLAHAETFPASLLHRLGELAVDLEVTLVDGPRFDRETWVRVLDHPN